MCLLCLYFIQQQQGKQQASLIDDEFVVYLRVLHLAPSGANLSLPPCCNKELTGDGEKEELLYNHIV